MKRVLASPLLFGVGALLAALLVVVVAISLDQLAGFAMQSELEDKVLDRPSPYLPEVRAHEAAELAGYRVIDAKTGIVGVPLERALELTLRDRRGP